MRKTISSVCMVAALAVLTGVSAKLYAGDGLLHPDPPTVDPYKSLTQTSFDHLVSITNSLTTTHPPTVDPYVNLTQTNHQRLVPRGTHP